ncbi:MAG: hypothetical protein U0359_20020 [Byssovorax sp.]
MRPRPAKPAAPEATAPAEATPRKPQDEETPVTRLPSVAPRKGRATLGVVMALLAGTLAGLAVVAHLRPDLMATLGERLGPALGGAPHAPASPAAGPEAASPGPASPGPASLPASAAR